MKEDAKTEQINIRESQFRRAAMMDLGKRRAQYQLGERDGRLGAVIAQKIFVAFRVRKKFQSITKSRLYEIVRADKHGIDLFDGVLSWLLNDGFIVVTKQRPEGRGRPAEMITWTGPRESKIVSERLAQ